MCLFVFLSGLARIFVYFSVFQSFQFFFSESWTKLIENSVKQQISGTPKSDADPETAVRQPVCYMPVLKFEFEYAAHAAPTSKFTNAPSNSAV